MRRIRAAKFLRQMPGRRPVRKAYTEKIKERIRKVHGKARTSTWFIMKMKKPDRKIRLSSCRTSSTHFSKMQAFSRWEAACCSALATLTRLQAEKTKFRGACPRNFGNLTLFRRLWTAKLCRGLFPMQEIVLFLQGAILFRQTESLIARSGFLFIYFRLA